MKMTYKEILPGINLRVIESDAFETNCISIQFVSEINNETASKMTLVPRVLRRGTVKHPDMESLAAELDEMYGARIEPVSRKYGDIISGGFVCDFVDPEKTLFGSVVKLLSEILFKPKLSDGIFVEEYVDGERTNLIDEIKSEINNKLSYAHKKAVEIMFKNTPYAVSELGTEEEAEKIDSASLYKYYKKLVCEAPCEIFFCGNTSFDEVKSAFLHMFSSLPARKGTKVKSGKPIYSELVRKKERLDISQANLLVGMYNENADIYASKLLCAVIGGGTCSKLFVNVREKQSLCYFTGTMYDSFEKSMFLYCGIDPKNAKIAEKAVLDEFENCVLAQITDEEIHNAKKGMIDDIITVDDSLFSMEAFWLRAALLGDERTPSEIAAYIRELDGEMLSDVARGFKTSVVYLLTGLEESENAAKLLPQA